MIKSLFLALRIKTLVAGFIPVVVAHCLVMSQGEKPLWWVTFCALAGAISIQIATNLLNDAIDFKKGADTADRVGPKRMTQSGQLSSKTVMYAGIAFLVLAVCFGGPLVWRGGVPILLLGLFSLFLAYGYTGGPFPLAYLGLGDLFVILFFGLFAVGGTYYLHLLRLDGIAIIAGLQVGFLATVLLAVNNLRDSETDAVANKKTLAVRLGDFFAKFEISLLIMATFALNAFYRGITWVNLSLLVAPLALYVLYLVWKVKDKRYLNKVLGLAALLQMSFGALLALGLIL